MKLLPALVGGVLAVLAPSGFAGVQGWLDFGAETPGESTDPGHAGWASVVSFSASNGPDGVNLVCHRALDKASPLLMDACAKGKHFTEVKLDVKRTVSNATTDYWEITLKDVIVSSYKSFSDETPAVVEDVTLVWKSMTFTYRVFPENSPSYTTTTIISPDTDGDGMPDAYEESVGLDPAVSNLKADTDGDGLPDVEEYRLGTNPNDPTSFFSSSASVANPDTGVLRIRWPSVAGEEYQIEYSPDLVTPFSVIASVTATSTESTHDVVRTAQTGFFRVSKTLP